MSCMEEAFVEQWRERVQAGLQSAVFELLPGEDWRVPLPHIFGSQSYGLGTSTSDLDLCILGPPHIVLEHGHNLRALVARRLTDLGIGQRKVSDQKSLRTLKWSWQGEARSFEISLLLTDTESGQEALQATRLLKAFYDQHKEYGSVVRAVLARLREKGSLNKHGWGQTVGQAMKTATMALWCAALKVKVPRLNTEADLYWALASFDAPRLAVQWRPWRQAPGGSRTLYDGWEAKEESCYCCKLRNENSKSTPSL